MNNYLAFQCPAALINREAPGKRYTTYSLVPSHDIYYLKIDPSPITVVGLCVANDFPGMSASVTHIEEIVARVYDGDLIHQYKLSNYN